MQILIKVIEDYAVAKGVYPSTMATISLPLKDPWECEYKYKIPGEHGKYDLFTLGSDHKEGGEGEKADITNWAETSLIGSWFEYTPTSAMDIEFTLYWNCSEKKTEALFLQKLPL